MSKMSLTEATMLALQGKLNLTEDVEIETNDAQVTVTPDKTIINNAEATVTVEQPEDVVVTDTVTEPEEVLPVEDTENIDTMVDDKPVESEVEDTVEEITESKKLQEDDESDEEDEESEESEETTEEESEVEEEPETTEEVPVEDQLTAIDDAVAKIRDMINTLPEEVKSEIFKCEDCEEVPVESEETTEEEIEEPIEEEIEEPIDELEECDKFNSKTFNEVFTKYYKKYNKKVEKFELTKLLKNKDTLKVEGRLFNTDSTAKELKLEMKQVQRGTKFARYELKTNKKVESVRGKQIMMVSAADKVLNCNYMINKK